MRGRFHEMLAQAIEKRVGELASALAMGACRDFAEYRYQAGIVAGLYSALDFAEDVNTKLQG